MRWTSAEGILVENKDTLRWKTLVSMEAIVRCVGFGGFFSWSSTEQDREDLRFGGPLEDPLAFSNAAKAAPRS